MPIGYSNTGYPGGVMTVNAGLDAETQANALGGNSGDFLSDIFAMRNQAKEQDMNRRLREERMRAAMLERQQQEHPDLSGVLASADPYEEQMKALALRREIAQTRAITGRAPTRRVSSANAFGYMDVDEPTMMTGAQRQRFMPQNSTFSPVAPPESPAGFIDEERKKMRGMQ
jgi:hypothetical protein